MDERARLEHIGLSTNESKVYLFLLDHPKTTAGKIAKGCELQRSSAYSAINTLIHKGLINYYSSNNINYFSSASPHRLIEFIKEKELIIQDMIPSLIKRSAFSKSDGHVKLYKGTNGVKSVFKDIIRTGKNNSVFGEDGNFKKVMPIFRLQYIRDQNEKKIQTRVLTRKRSTSQSKGTNYRFVDQTTKSNMAINIYGNKIGIIIWTDIPEAIIIENTEAAKSLQAYFEYMWKHAKKDTI